MQLSPKLSKGNLSVLSKVAILTIRIYQASMSRMLRRHGVTCLHYPTCSNYGIMAFEKYGFCKAFSVTINRCRDCHPFSGRAYIDYP